MAIKYTKHAKEMLVLRGIEEKLADQTVNSPDKTLPTREEKKIYLKDLGENYLMLVVAEEMGDQIVVTAHWLDKRRAEKL